MTITKTCSGAGAGLAWGVEGGDGWLDGAALGLGAWARDADGVHAASRQAIAARAANLISIQPTIGADLNLRADPWAMTIRPERGGRITSLRLAGEELLDQGIGVDEPGAAGFVEGGAWGWDEMVPTLDPTDGLPDHGEAWRLPWQVIEQSALRAVMRCTGRLLPWELERTIELSADGVRLGYVLSNVGPEPLHAYWCAHPLFRYERGMEVSVPGGRQLAALPEGSSTKIHLMKGSLDRVHVAWPSGTAIEMSWDSSLTPYVGVWACNGDLGGYRQLAVEPATGGGDRPDPAAPPPLLGPGGRFSWWLRLSSSEPPAH
jgi:galactose mutarotase-like enzyme